ncbi:MAG TPA: hypothetical protein VHZ95_23160 [Polyangiales bacterium]|nr:hypothetical protein [Polyangiales bacterium]
MQCEFPARLRRQRRDVDLPFGDGELAIAEPGEKLTASFGAIAADHEHARRARRAKDLQQEAYAIGVGPLHVVQEPCHRTLLGDQVNDFSQRAERSAPLFLRAIRFRGRFWRRWPQVSQDGEHAGKRGPIGRVDCQALVAMPQLNCESIDECIDALVRHRLVLVATPL